MKTVDQLSERTRKKYVLLLKLGIPIEFKDATNSDDPWTLTDDPEHDIGWLQIVAPNAAAWNMWYIRRAPRVKKK